MSDKKYFQLDGIYNRQDIRIYAASHEEADCKNDIHRKNQHSVQVLVWLGACFQGVTRLGIIEEGTFSADRYIEEVLSIVLEDDKVRLGDDFTFQQDGASLYRDEKNIIMV